ncbi:hypothetical protein PJF56_10145 [Roseofilum sp. BLCC_M91]|uniref:CopG family transcriptional regulator n=1 Tax=Roseofilum halophilum BLCC-M91 TaxID=3022259 RepID=A0ABT7BL75_9CYAN|nr:hypothetical protein [Roseofilum halophilum]MDJ1179226.1 hypothetical protein [Roseofilum halophilum BLCC-M91]
MSNYTITLSEKTYYSLLEVVEKQGLTPEAWIVAQLPKPQPEDPWQVMFDALQEFPEDLQIERDRSLPMEREPIE